MLDFLVALMQGALWVALILNFIVLFGMRAFYAFKNQLKSKELVAVLFLPFSYGYLHSQKDKTTFHFIYQVILVLTFLSILIGSIMVFYTHFA